MNTRPLGDGGPRVSEVGLRLGPDGEPAGVQRALERGVNFIDTGVVDVPIVPEVMGMLKDRRGEIVVALKIAPADGPEPPGPYCRWQDRYPAAHLRDKVSGRVSGLGLDRVELLQLSTWTRAWNDDPQPLLVLRQLRDEGMTDLIGVAAPRNDQDCVIELMRDGLVDVVEIAFDLRRQHAAAQLLPVASETGTGVVLRPAGELSAATVEELTADLHRVGLAGDLSPEQVAIRSAVSRPEVSTLLFETTEAERIDEIIRAASLPPLPQTLLERLRRYHQG